MRSLKYLESDEVIKNKWGYATFAAVISMAMAYDSGVVSPTLGFVLGYLCVFSSLLGLELWGQKIRQKRQINQELKAISDNAATSQQARAS